MFSIGDQIVYPMHGAGIIEAIEEKMILGESRRYYILHIPFGDMKVMIPCDSTDSVGVRGIITKSQLSAIEKALTDDSTEMSDNWNRRYRDNMEKLKTGDLTDVCEVVRNLMRIDRIKKLSTGEKKLLSNAKQILLSELILVCKKNSDEISVFIEELVLRNI
ncbi:MAG: CarD family transcriptional regulator [Clostridiales Family XIII bacterium]|nr:CarD family transcriptional regulator [Clostridiales Family XIII bacterium]